MLRGILPFTISEVLTLEPPRTDEEPGPVAEPPQGEQDSLLDVAVDRMEGHGPTAHQVWLPPLDVPDTLDVLMPDLVEDPELGLVSPEWRRLGGMVMSIGTVDRPREQRRAFHVPPARDPPGSAGRTPSGPSDNRSS